MYNNCKQYSNEIKFYILSKVSEIDISKGHNTNIKELIIAFLNN